MSGRTRRPWMAWPMIQQAMYFPRLANSKPTSSISTILAATRNIIPSGAYLRKRKQVEVKRRMHRTQFKHWEKHMVLPYHMIQETNTMVASLKELKNLIRISPSSPSFLKATPNAIAKTMRPRMFIPSTSVPTGV